MIFLLILNVSCVTTYSQSGSKIIKVQRLTKQLIFEKDSLKESKRKYKIVRRFNGMTFCILENSNISNDSVIFSRNFLFYNSERFLNNRVWNSFDPVCSGLTNKKNE